MGKGSIVIIGSGAAGSACAKRLARAGWDVSIIERGRLGGTCLWYGCVPKKALYEAAYAARRLRAAEQFGVTCSDMKVDWHSTLAWKWHVQTTYAGDQEQLFRDTGVTPVRGEARFMSEREIEVDGARMAFDHAVVATGSVPALPPIPGIALADTSRDALRYEQLPRTLTIVGGGFIAYEMAGIFASLGTKVSVLVHGPQPLSAFDPEIADVATQGLASLGVAVVTNVSVNAIEGETGSLTLVCSDATAEYGIETERVLMATGRRPDFSTLGLDRAGVMTDERGRPVLDASLRSTNPRIWFAGDATGGQMHTPIANLEGRTVADSIDSGAPGTPDCTGLPVACFTYPEVALAGMTSADAAREGIDTEVKTIDATVLAAPLIADERLSRTRVIAEKASGRILGVQMAGHDASSLIYAGTLAVRAGLTLSHLRSAPAIHPSFSEGLYYTGD